MIEKIPNITHLLILRYARTTKKLTDIPNALKNQEPSNVLANNRLLAKLIKASKKGIPE